MTRLWTVFCPSADDQPALLSLPEDARGEILATAARDVARTTLAALLSHLVLFTLVGLASGLLLARPAATVAVAALASAAGLVRLALARRPQPTHRWWGLTALMAIINAGSWSGLTFYVTRLYGMQLPTLIYWMAGAGIASGAVATLKPNPALGRAYIATLLFPMAYAALLEPRGGVALATIFLTYFGFLFGMGRDTSRNYWHGLVNDAQLRARGAALERFQVDTNKQHAMAERVLRNIVERSTFDLPSLRVNVSPIERFNGDLVMAIPTGGRRLRFFLGDFTGHGLGAAVGALPVADIFFATAHRSLPIEIALREMNSKLRRTLPREIFLAAMIGEIDMSNQRLAYWNGGLPDGYLVHADGRGQTVLRSTRLPIGILEDRDFDTGLLVTELGIGDRMFVCTDGIIEAENAGQEPFGADRLIGALAEAPIAGFSSLAIDRALLAHRGGSAMRDDATYLEVRCDHALDLALAARDNEDLDASPVRIETMELRFPPPRLRVSDPLEELRLFLERQLPSDRGRAVATSVMSELFVNAVDYGLLKLDSSLKDGPDGIACYFALREERLRELHQGQVTVQLTVTETAPHILVKVRVTDTGFGFVLPPDDTAFALTDNVRKRGRGLALVRQFSRKANWYDGGRVAEAEILVSTLASSVDRAPATSSAGIRS